MGVVTSLQGDYQTASLLEDTEDSQDTVDGMDVLLETVQQPEKPAGLEAVRNEG